MSNRIDDQWNYADSYEFMERVQKGMPPLIICVACNGGVQGKEYNDNLPETADDDCNGIIDDTPEGKCGCSGGNSPTREICNLIDDDCDGLVDNGVCSCTTGETQFCGSDIGRCTKGVMSCVGGIWSSECQNSIKPVKEICYNDEDDDCDNHVDEGCTPEMTCDNKIQDLNENGVDCGDDCPVEKVSWDDAQEFIQKLNEMDKTYKYRLPTEAEWEYASRADSLRSYSFRNSESGLGMYAWYSSNSSAKTHRVAQKKPNDWGLYDIHDNVWE